MTTDAQAPARALWPAEIGGPRDLQHIAPSGRRLTEYEAVTCYTQPSSIGGGLQTAGEWALRPDLHLLFSSESTEARCDDWYAFRDPNQMWQRPYYAMQHHAERGIDRASDVAITTGMVAASAPEWRNSLLETIYLPFSHLEYGLFRALNVAARESLSDTVNNVLLFNAADKLRHAQAIAIAGLDLEKCLDGFDASTARAHWLDHPMWQPPRRLVEEVMAVEDWVETAVAVNCVVEPLLAEPFRRWVGQSAASRRGDPIMPVIAATATADWLRNSRWTAAFVEFLIHGRHGDENRRLLVGWMETWEERVRPVADGVFEAVGATLGEPGLVERLAVTGQEEQRRACHTLGELVRT